MADKIVQLIDKDNNNIFPVAGSMKQGAVTTNLLADGAVTAAKIANNAIGSEKFNPTVSTMTFTLRRVGGSSSTHTGTKIHLGGNIYIYAGAAESSVAGSSSTGTKEYAITFSKPFTTLYSGVINGAAVGSSGTYMEYSAMTRTGADFYLYHNTTDQRARCEFIAIGTIE